MARMAGKVAEDFFLQCVILASPDPGAGDVKLVYHQ